MILREKNWLKYPIQPFNQLLRHTYFPKVDLLKKILANLRKSTNSTTNCDTCFQKMETGKLIIRRISIQPFQPAFATHIFRKLDFSRKYFQQVGRFNNSPSFARHTYLKMSFCERKVKPRNIQVNQSTSFCTTHIFKNKDFLKKDFGESLRINQINQCLRPMPPDNGNYRNVFRWISVQPFNQLLLHTHILKIDFLKKDVGESSQINHCLQRMPPENWN
jgi:hypothetical protein